MKISDILSQLTYGELRQVGLGGFEFGGVRTEDYPELVSHLNIALRNIYTRFPIKDKELIVCPVAGQTEYELSSEFAYSSGNENWFILDTVEKPYTDDLLKIGTVYDSAGEVVSLNDHNDPYGVFTPSYKTIQIPLFSSGNLHLIYRMAPTIIVPPVDEDDATEVAAFLNTEVYLPEPLEEAFYSYVEYRVHKSRGGELGIATAAAAKQNYDLLCAEIEKRDVLNSPSVATNVRPELNGWV